MNKRITKIDLANFFMDKQHPDQKSDLDQSIIDIPSSTCFLLKVYNSKKEVKRLYLICLLGMLMSVDSRPFHKKMLKYYENIQTIPLGNYYIGYIIVDDNFNPIDTQVFEIPEELKEIAISNMSS